MTRYQRTKHQRPIATHTQHAFDLVRDWLNDWQGPLMLDSCCGVGRSTQQIAELYPEAKVVGIDKSASRIAKTQAMTEVAAPKETTNYLVVRADVQDFWRLAQQAQWPIDKHYLLYPNPYPKPTQVQRRWHASPAMVSLMAISQQVEVRSNWRVYCEEFAQACGCYGWQADLTEVGDERPSTPFEMKYKHSGQTCWRLVARQP